MCKRTKDQREFDLAFCSNLFLRGYTYKEISERLNEENARRGVGYTISKQMVYWDIQQLLIEWKRERMENIDDYVTQELRKLDKMEVELWEAWERSKTGKLREKNRQNAKPRKVLEDGDNPEYYGYEETTTETSAGNPRFLDLLLNVQQRRAKMLGFDAPIKVDIPGLKENTNSDAPKYDVAAIPEDLLFAIADKLQTAEYKKQLAEKHAKFYIIDANSLAAKIGLGRRTNTILQSAFFYLNQNIMPYDQAQDWMKKFAQKSYAKKGDDIVKMNWDAIDAGAQGLIEIKVKDEWASLDGTRVYATTGDEYFDSFVNVIGSLDGYNLPVSKFLDYELLDGTMRNDVTFMEKRSIADRVPMWIKENCIQCNQCAFVCPHATIRPFLLNEEETKNLPEAVKNDVLPAMGGPAVKGLTFRIQVSPKNCVGCGLCVVECPGKAGKKALEMVEAKSQFDTQEPAADYLYKHVEYKNGGFPVTTVKGASFLMPYAEVSGACAGCGETPYYRLASQLFGKDMLIANATGCSSIYNGSTPLTPFCTDKDGNGIAWANSLFEDNAEYGFGMRIATDYKLGQICKIFEANKANVEPELQQAIEDYETHIKDRDYVRGMVKHLVELVKASKNEEVKAVLEYERDLVDKSVWIVGGDGWSYDIGYGGLDHVIANEEDVNILVLDTEVYSNTGGQSSKSSQTGSIAKFTASGKKTAKKNLALMTISYGNVYVAQIAMGANKMQAIKAMKEAESYNGPSLIICYSPCQAHGLKGGLANAQKTEKEAVECGYFPIFRYDPRLEAEGKCPMQMDSKDPDFSKFRDFVMTQTRYSQLPKVNPEHAEELLTKSQQYAEMRYKRFKKLCD